MQAAQQAGRHCKGGERSRLALCSWAPLFTNWDSRFQIRSSGSSPNRSCTMRGGVEGWLTAGECFMPCAKRATPTPHRQLASARSPRPCPRSAAAGPRRGPARAAWRPRRGRCAGAGRRRRARCPARAPADAEKSHPSCRCMGDAKDSRGAARVRSALLAGGRRQAQGCSQTAPVRPLRNREATHEILRPQRWQATSAGGRSWSLLPRRWAAAGLQGEEQGGGWRAAVGNEAAGGESCRLSS